MLGYDSVNFKVDVSLLPVDAPNQLAELLPREGYNSATGARWQAGSVGNLTVTLNELGLSVNGSLASFYFGNNTLTVPRREVKNALQKLSDTLHVDMTKAEVKRLDISTSLQMRNKVQAYLDILGTLSYFSRTNVTKNTLLYVRGEGRKQELCFYDKLRESKDKHQAKDFPTPYKDAGNVLRYEARLMRQIPQQLGESVVTGAMLDDVGLFRKVAKFWEKSYFCIQKTYTDIDMTQIKTPKDAQEVLFAHLLNEAGAGTLDKYLSQLKAKGVFSNRQYYTNFKTSIKRIMDKYSDKGGESLARELDNAIRTELSYL